MISSDSEENDERFSGSELEEPANEEGESVRVSVVELDEPGDEERELIPEEEKSKGIWGKYREKPRLSLFIAIGLCLLMGIGYLYLKGKIFNIIVDQKGKIPELDRLAIPKDQLLIFPSFVIPFRENKRFSYISLSIYFNLPNKELMREMIEKKGELRGIIYDILRQEINKLKEVPSLEELKGFIIRGVNTALSAGKVNEVYITKFLAV